MTSRIKNINIHGLLLVVVAVLVAHRVRPCAAFTFPGTLSPTTSTSHSSSNSSNSNSSNSSKWRRNHCSQGTFQSRPRRPISCYFHRNPRLTEEKEEHDTAPSIYTKRRSSHRTSSFSVLPSICASTTRLYNVPPKSNSNSKPKGVYSRPSAAIERGSGFFVPGLEGSRVRILFGILVLFLSYITTMNNGLGNSNVNAVEFSQKLVWCYGILLLFQGMVESAKEAGLGRFVFLEDDEEVVDEGSSNQDENASRSSNKSNRKNGGRGMSMSRGAKELEQRVSRELREDWVLLERVRWIAASLVALTPATHVLWLVEEEEEEKDDGSVEKMESGARYGIWYSLGNDVKTTGVMSENIDSATSSSSSSSSRGIQSAIDTVYKSKGGRVSVPDSHPCAMLLPEDCRRCIVLQRVQQGDEDNDTNNRETKRTCLMIGSNQLLAAFTKNDLKWLGSLASYLSMDEGI